MFGGVLPVRADECLAVAYHFLRSLSLGIRLWLVVRFAVPPRARPIGITCAWWAPGGLAGGVIAEGSIMLTAYRRG